jgi:hypothetical protein
MRKLLLSFYFACCILHFSFSQNPLVKQWDKRFGGTNHVLLYSLEQTTDGGFILGGYSYSQIGGDKTQPLWDTCIFCPFLGDYWIVKTDSMGNKQWDKDFGTLGTDYFFSLKQTFDGGFILGGFTAAGIGGDKTQPNWDTIYVTHGVLIIIGS